MSNSPTGRLPSEPEMQDLRDRTRGEIMLIQGMDFGEIEMRMLALMADPAIDEIVLVADYPPCEMLDIAGKPGLLEEMMREIPKKAAAEDRPPPSYLQHDPFKDTRRYRK